MTLFRLIRGGVFAFAVAALISFASSDAQAQCYGGGYYGGGYYGGGYYGGGFGGYHGGGLGIHVGRVGVHIGPVGGFHGGYGGFGYGVPAHTWHDTSLWDYHPGQFVPHGNHFHYQPGHYDFHHTGHLHHNHW